MTAEAEAEVGGASPGASVEPDATDGPLVSFVIATYNRPGDLAEAIQSVLHQSYERIEVVVVSDSTDRTAAMFEGGARFDREEISYHHFDERMGAPRAKNRGLERAAGDVVVQLDDDAILAEPSATERMLQLFSEHEDVGVLAFQSRDYYTGEVKYDETPDPPEFDMTPLETYRATNFVGLGVAFRRAALDEAGLYPDDFVYGFEEMDLSFRVHDTGYDILYTPSVVVYHKKSPEGRISDVETKERLAENRINMALRNLPWRYVFFTTLIYSVYVVLLTRQLSSLGRMYRRLYEKRLAVVEDRQVVSGETLARIKSRKTMLFGWWYGPHPGRILGSHGDVRRLTWEA